MAYETLKLEKDDGLALLTLSRPERRNAISFSMLRELHRALDEIESDASLGAVILAGEGRDFSVGADILGGSGAADRVWEEGLGKVQWMSRMLVAFGRVAKRWREMHPVSVAAVKGNVAGGGFSLAMASDICIAAESSRFIPAYVRIGLSGGDMGSAFFLPKLAGPGGAAEILYTGRTVAAEEALRLGIANRVVKEEDLSGETRAFARRIVENAAPHALRRTKELLNLSLSGVSLSAFLRAVEL